jgi:hypothetical protein
LRFSPFTRASLASACLATVSALAACGGDDGPAIRAECNPLGGVSCLMPWPSATYMVEDSSTATGFRVDLPAEALPVNINNRAVAPDRLNRWDGFSPSGPIVATFPTGASADGLPPLTDPGASLDASSPIVLVNMDTGERAAFFAEVDMNAPEPTQRALIIRPVQRLAPGTRYAVGISKAVKAADGGELPIPEAFAAVRDGASYDHPRMAALEPRYDAIFAALEEEGLARDQLVLAWDFVTASDEFLTSDLRAMRDDALPEMGEDGANITFQAEELTGDGVRVHKLLFGTLTSPNFLSNGEENDSELVRDASGRPQLDGTRDANFAAIIPQCVTTATAPIPVMIFGHGLFGTGDGYLNDRLLQQVAQDYCFVVVAGDWIGLTERQLDNAVLAANDLNRAYGITEKLAQSVIDFIALQHAVRGPFLASPQFAYEGTPVIDPTRVYYFGASLGGIMGSSFMAYDPYVTRGVLGVPGGPWSMLFERSFAWVALEGPAHASYPAPEDYQILISILAMAFEPYDPITAAPHLLNDPLPGSTEKQILLYETIDDSLVANVASETLGRTIGLPVVMPSLSMPYGLEPAGPDAANGFAIYDEAATPAPPEFNQPPLRDNGTHSDVHERPAVLRQIEAFLYDGVVNNQCTDGASAAPCYCAEGACE